MQKLAIIAAIVAAGILAVVINNTRPTLYEAIGKIESDSDYCLSAGEIAAIQRAPITAEYKNYLFEQDMRKREAVNNGYNQLVEYKNCEL